MVPIVEMKMSTSDKGIVAAVSGEIDMSNADRFEELLTGVLAMADGDVVLDMSAVAFMDVSAFRVLIEAVRTASGARLALREPSPNVRVVLDVLAPSYFTILEA
jgi:anti-anti-sigma factor